MFEDLTIALPVYKRTDYIRLALDSAVNQSVKCRILLVDNNSPHDDFRDIVNSYQNPLIEYIKTRETVPQDENFNNCIRFSKTPWITILHDDDYLHFQFVELAQQIVQRHGSAMGGFCVRNHVDSAEWPDVSKPLALVRQYRVVKPSYFFFKQLSPFPGVVFNRKLGMDLNGFDVPLHPIADLDFWRRLTESSTMLYVNQTLAYYRISSNQSTNRLIDDMIHNVYRYRLNLQRRRGMQQNLLIRLGIEYVRITGIRFFMNQYPHISIPRDYPNPVWFRFTNLLMKLPFFSRFMNWYINRLCYGTLLCH